MVRGHGQLMLLMVQGSVSIGDYEHSVLAQQHGGIAVGRQSAGAACLGLGAGRDGRNMIMHIEKQGIGRGYNCTHHSKRKQLSALLAVWGHTARAGKRNIAP